MRDPSLGFDIVLPASFKAHDPIQGGPSSHVGRKENILCGTAEAADDHAC